MFRPTLGSLITEGTRWSLHSLNPVLCVEFGSQSRNSDQTLKMKKVGSCLDETVMCYIVMEPPGMQRVGALQTPLQNSSHCQLTGGIFFSCCMIGSLRDGDLGTYTGSEK